MENLPELFVVTSSIHILSCDVGLSFQTVFDIARCKAQRSKRLRASAGNSSRLPGINFSIIRFFQRSDPVSLNGSTPSWNLRLGLYSTPSNLNLETMQSKSNLVQKIVYRMLNANNLFEKPAYQRPCE